MEIKRNLKNRTSSEFNISKLPPTLQKYTANELEEALASAVHELVQQRGIPFEDITGTEMEAKIRGATSWLKGSRHRSCLLLQGNAGTGKTTLLEALYAMYNAANASIVSTNGVDLNMAFAQQIAGTSSAYDEYRKMPRLCIDDLGAEPVRCMIYGIEYTPIQTLLEYRYRRQLPTIITTNLSDKMIEERYGERLNDRFSEMCTILRFSGQSYRR